jgi:asparagine synthase (glutamine-hydrolysing)
MCGFVGLLDREGAAQGQAQRLQRGCDALTHRGPDDEGAWFDGPIGLGFRRLSILDLTPAGHQPMVSANGEWAIVFNGEIYNYIELARDLRQHGVVFRSHCDTEVLVEALAHWGPRCFERFNGMWAVLAWHRPSQTLFACRDPWGIKPLFVAEDAGTVAFASEIKGLRAMGCVLGDVDAVAARRFLDNAELDTDTRTLFGQVHRLQPGVMHRYRHGRLLDARPYGDGADALDVPGFPDDERGEADFVEAFRSAMLDSVRIRLRADVDVGTCLSGGLDSTTIACAAAQFLDQDDVTTCRHAFTALLPEFDESRYIRSVVEQTGAEWHVTVASDAQVRDRLEGFFRAHDEPVHSLSALAGYLVMGLASDAGVKVLLNGQGSDEALAGYTSAVLPFLRSVLREDGLRYGFRQAVQEAGGSRVRGMELVMRAHAGRLARALPQPMEALLRHALPLVGARETELVLADGPLGMRQQRLHPPTDSLNSALADQVGRSPLPLYLRIEDANSSAFSLESRLPFLDPTVIALARAAPARMLRRGGLNKYLLRRILPGLVPDIVWQRREKMGFPVPHARWFRGPLREILTETLSEDRLRKRGWYHPKPVIDQVQQFLGDPTHPFPPRLLRLFLLERWAREQLDG